VDEISQREKREVLKVDTYFNRAQAEADMAVGGRWKKQTETRVTGTPTYPQQPSSSPWSQSLEELTGPEPPLDIDLNFVGDLGGASAPASSPCAVETASSTRGGSPTALTDPPRFLRS
jgi:hypothetical protein